MKELSENTVIPLEGTGELKIINEIGKGGQGQVYKVSFNNNEYALKWYDEQKINDIEKFKNNLRKNIMDGTPSENFLWPKYLTKEYNGSFGYLMDLRQDNFCEFSNILNKKNEFSHVDTMILSALNIVVSFRELHRQGKSYQDLNDGNFFIDTETGKVLICDNDNIAPDKENLGIAGKPGYMAPEIVRGDSKPEVLTDQYSLAVVLFKLFIRHDPLMGKAYIDQLCITEEAEKKLYGTNPVFIFDPDDQSNRPVPGVHHNPLNLWPKYPSYLQKAFIRSFCDGIKNPYTRLTENEWIKILIQLRNDLVACPKCQFESFFTDCHKTNKISWNCEHCNTEFIFPFMLKIKEYNIPLLPGKKLYKCHTSNDSNNFNDEEAYIVKNKKNPNILAIKNTSQKTWYYVHNEKRTPLPPNGFGVIQDKVNIDFDNVNGKIYLKKEK